MKTIEYYCSHHFDPASAATMLAPDWLESKINAAHLTITDLLFIDYMHRDNGRIGKISKAVKHWMKLLDEINEVHSQID